jgi:hypothetical protein
MKHPCTPRVVQTIDLGYEQLQIIEEPDQQIRVLFRGTWLRAASVDVASTNVKPDATSRADVVHRPVVL